MIYLPRFQLVIITPPKCATHSLHKLLCSERFGGQHVIGPSLGSRERIDWHTCDVPAEAEGYRKLGVVRNPWDRLVSLYHHRVTYDAGHGRATPAFWFFANQVGRGELSDPFYGWNLARFYRDKPIDSFLRVDLLAADLRAAGLPLSDDEQLPREHASHRFRPTAEYFDHFGTRVAVERWCNEDSERWGYPTAAE